MRMFLSNQWHTQIKVIDLKDICGHAPIPQTLDYKTTTSFCILNKSGKRRLFSRKRMPNQTMILEFCLYFGYYLHYYSPLILINLNSVGEVSNFIQLVEYSHYTVFLLIWPSLEGCTSYYQQILLKSILRRSENYILIAMYLPLLTLFIFRDF